MTFFLDDLRRSVWPLLLGVDATQCERVPSLEELSSHSEYNQVVLDVNRSLKRFPPGIPLQQRLALQDQLTIIILRVISKYPHLSYYQVRFYPANFYYSPRCKSRSNLNSFDHFNALLSTFKLFRAL